MLLLNAMLYNRFPKNAYSTYFVNFSKRLKTRSNKRCLEGIEKTFGALSFHRIKRIGETLAIRMNYSDAIILCFNIQDSYLTKKI